MIESRNSRYLVAREDGVIVGAIGFTFDPVGRSIKVLELIDLRDDVAGFLLRELDQWAAKVYHAEYVEITVSAYWPDIQRTLSNLGFVPVAYCPSFVFHEVERLDTLKMAKLYVPLDIDGVQLTDASREMFELVRKGFEDKRLGIAANETARQMAIFEGLEDGELSHIAGLCQVRKAAEGEIILREGEQGEVSFMVMSGFIDIYANGAKIGHVFAGDFLGEISLVSGRPYNATAVAAANVTLVQLRRDDFQNLIDRHPRIGLKVMRNIVISLGEKLSVLGGRYSRSQRPHDSEAAAITGKR